CTTGWHW
nr:immunoglobulin heavy chain junction region [Mus musculus]